MRRIRVLLVGEPALLAEVLAMACDETAGIEVVDGVDSDPEVVVLTVGATPQSGEPYVVGSPPSARVLAVSAATNEIWGWERGPDRPAEHRLLGTVENLLGLIQRYGRTVEAAEEGEKAGVDDAI
jgi:hypothetical protein